MDLARGLGSKGRLSRRGIGIALDRCLVTNLSLNLLQIASQRAVQFVVLDPNGNTIIAPGARSQDAIELHVQQALQATTSLLNRHPKDFDHPEALKFMLARRALAHDAALKTADPPEL